jgi:hypothetical protein
MSPYRFAGRALALVSLAALFGLAVAPSRAGLFVGSGTNQVLEYDGTTGAFVAPFVAAGSGGLDQPTFLTFSPAVVPEPGSAVLACLGGLLLLGYVKRRRLRRASP